MDEQLTLTVVAIALAVGYVAWRGSRLLKTTPGACGGGCGCAKGTPKAEIQPAALIAPEQLMLRGSRATPEGR